MVDQNKELLDQFQKIHDEYVLNPDANKAKFNTSLDTFFLYSILAML